MKFTFKATKPFWRKFDKLSRAQKEAAWEKWKIFKMDPFDPRLNTHPIEALTARASVKIYSATIEQDLKVLFRIDGSVLTSLMIGTHKIYR
ncbi:MAG TPA: hypothetical protein VMN36_05905 [Verrucomicrobiales bacterium]|nr:hypothetical protein [Verrucomicrobiales bacterium]